MKTKVHLQMCKINQSNFFVLLNGLIYDVDGEMFWKVWDLKYETFFLMFYPEENILRLTFDYDESTPLWDYSYLSWPWKEMVKEDED